MQRLDAQMQGLVEGLWLHREGGNHRLQRHIRTRPIF
jgi:hypothetical protein